MPRGDLADPQVVDARQVATALRAALVTILVTIATVSAIDFVPLLIWLVLGMCAGLSRLQLTQVAPLQTSVTEGRMT